MAEFTNDKKDPFIKKGKMIENEFAKLFKETISSTKNEDIKEHWDLKIITKVDVKGLKKIKRDNEETNEHIHWLEIKNVQGKAGSCYGEAEYFAFELINYWVIVSKEDLQLFIKENIKKEWVEKPELYKLYQRKGRKDVLTLVTSYDLCYISSCIISKK